MSAAAARLTRKHRPDAQAWPCLGVMALLCACASAPAVHTTFLRSVDLTDMTDRMASSFARDETIASRQSSDQPWVISIDRVVNRTNQLIPDREKWLYVARLRSLLAQTDVAEQRSIIWVIPPERWDALVTELGPEPPDLRMKPTHLLTAQFDALTNTSGNSRGPGGRSDMYLCAFELVDLRSGQVVWHDRWEVKRAVTGLTYD